MRSSRPSAHQTVTGLQNQVDQANFEKAVVTGFMTDQGAWIDGHPDAYKLMATKEYTDWFESELKKDPSLGNISDPGAAIGVLTRFKTHKAQAAAQAHDARQTDTAQDVKDMASGAVETGTSTGPDKKPKSEEEGSPEEIFEQFAT